MLTKPLETFFFFVGKEENALTKKLRGKEIITDGSVMIQTLFVRA